MPSKEFEEWAANRASSRSNTTSTAGANSSRPVPIPEANRSTDPEMEIELTAPKQETPAETGKTAFEIWAEQRKSMRSQQSVSTPSGLNSPSADTGKSDTEETLGTLTLGQWGSNTETARSARRAELQKELQEIEAYEGYITDAETGSLTAARKKAIKDELAQIDAAAAPAFTDWEGRSELINELNEIDNNSGYFTDTETTTALEARRKQIIAALEAGDAAAGNEIGSYDEANRGRQVLAGATLDYIAGFASHLGTWLDALYSAVDTNPYAGWATDEYTASVIGYEHDESKMGDYAFVKKGADTLEETAKKLGNSAQTDLQKAKAGLSQFGQAGVDIAVNIIQMGYDYGIGRLLGGHSLIPMFIRSSGSASMEAREAGANVDQQLVYGLAKGGIEAFTEKFFDGVAKIYGAGIADNVTEEVIRRLAGTTTGRTLLRVIINAAGEGGEEAISDLLDPFAKLIYDSNAVKEAWANRKEFAAEMLYDYLIGAAIGGLGGATNVITGADAQANAELDRRDAEIGNTEKKPVSGQRWKLGSLTQEELQERAEYTRQRLNLDRTLSPEEQQRRRENARKRLGLDQAQNPLAETGDAELELLHKSAATALEQEGVDPETKAQLRILQTAAEAELQNRADTNTQGGINNVESREPDGQNIPQRRETNYADGGETAAAGTPTAGAEWAGSEPDGGQERNDGAGAGRKTGSVDGGTAERSRRAAEQRRIAADRQSLGNALWERGEINLQSAQELGIATGSDTQDLKVFPEANYDEEMQAVSQRVAYETGLPVTFVSGLIHTRNTDGSYGRRRAVITNSSIIIQADNPNVSVTQLAEHEIFHAWQRADEGLRTAARDKILQTYGREEFAQVLQGYIKSHRGIIDVDENTSVETMDRAALDLIEEILADAHADINAFGLGAYRFRDAVESTVKERRGMQEQNRSGERETRGPPQRFSYGGEFAWDADIPALEVAESMEQEGTDDETIRQDTGWFRGMDGKWRFEIDDSAMELRENWKDSLTKQHGVEGMKLSDILEHKNLFDQYPELANIDVSFDIISGSRTLGWYQAPTGEDRADNRPGHISLNERLLQEDNRDDLMDTLIHELQHAIQDTEGFTRGSSPDAWQRRINDGYDNRMPADKQAAQQAADELRELRRVEPEYYRDMMDLMEDVPTLPRGAFDWDTLEQIEEDPKEWQDWDARRDSMERKYGDRIFNFIDMYDDLNGTGKKRRDALDLYLNTAGEIEARDTEYRRGWDRDSRQETAPRRGNEYTVFAEEGDENFNYVGERADGIEVYETSPEVKALHWGERRHRFMDLMENQYQGRTARFTKDGEVLYARFAPEDIKKNIYGDLKSDDAGKDAKINAGADGDIFDLVENARYDHSEDERGKSGKAHRGIESWDYFVKKVQIDGKVFDLLANVRKSSDAEYVYSLQLNEDKSTEAAPPDRLANDQSLNGALTASNNSISEESENSNTKFSMDDTVEETDTLIAVHNKSVSGLRRMLQRGGVPFPSIAIKKAGTSHEGFGDVSIVFPRSSIDPQTNRQNRLYSNDAWTPTEPREEYDVGDMWRYKKNLRNAVGEQIYNGLKGGSYLEEDQVAKKLLDSKGDIYEALKDVDVLKYAYLQSIGQAPDVPVSEASLDKFGKYKNDQLIAVFNAVSAEEIEGLTYDTTETLQKIADALNEKYMERFERDSDVLAILRKKPPYTADKINPIAIQDAYHRYIQNGNRVRSEPDFYELVRVLRNNSLLNEPGYRNWIESTFSDLIQDRGIPNGKDFYTDSGNRRSFKARHVPATLENIVKQMQKEQERGNGIFGVNLRGAATKTYSDVEEMRADSGRLLGTQLSDDVFDSYMNGFNNRLSALTERGAKDKNSWESLDSAEQIMLEAVRDAKSKAQMNSILKKEARWFNYSESLVDDLWELRNDVQNMPAPYFEAKPRRIVYPEEALAYVLPDNADEDVVQMLNERGYNVITYKAGDEQDRLEKLNSIENARFSTDDGLEGAVYGDLDETYVNDTEPVKFRWAVVPLGSLTISNDTSGAVNPNYPSELQPRDRTRTASQMKMQEISQNLIPRKLADSAEAQNGAPIIRSDGVVVGGNLRSMALADAYAKGRADAYEEYLRQNGKRYGLDTAELPENPVLVRVAEDVSDWGKLARDLNTSTIAAYSATERAMADAARMDSRIMAMLNPDEDGNINTAANRDFIQSFIANVVPDNERGAAITGSGLLSQDGLERAEYAIFAAAYQDAELMQRMSESLDNDMKNVTNGLLDIAPKVMQTQAAVDAGQMYDTRATDNLLEAVRLYTEAKRAGQTVEERTANQSLTDNFSDEVIYTARLIERFKRSAKQIRTFFNGLYDEIENYGDPNQMNLFGEEEEHSYREALEGAIKRYEQETGTALPALGDWGAGWYEATDRGNETETAKPIYESPDSSSGESSGREKIEETVPWDASPLPPPPTAPENPSNVQTEAEQAASSARQRDLQRMARRREKDQTRQRKQRPTKFPRYPEYDPLKEFEGTENPVKEYIKAAQARAAAAKAERLMQAEKRNFTGTPALQKLGVHIESSVGNYAHVDQLLARERAAYQLRRTIRQREAKLNATAKEKQFASGIAAGIYTAEDIPANMSRGKVEELADYYWAEKAVASDMIAQRRKDINLGLDDQMDELLKDSELYKVPPAIVLNYRTPERICKTIWGDEHGQAVYDAVFRPVSVNESEKIRFINRMFDEVRAFEGSDGKQTELNKEERVLTQQVLEGRAVQELVASMEMHEAIENAANNILNGEDVSDAAREFSLTEQERGIAEQYARWIQTKAIYESGDFDTVKIDNAVKKYSEMYDQMYDAINDFLVAHGYDPIGFIKGYAPHMQMSEDLNLFAGYLDRLGFNTNVTRLPASIAGKTADYKPNKRWNPYFLQRTGDMTDFDIAKGFESYVNYLSDVLYHTDDIMRVRAMSRYYRRTFAPDEIRETLDWVHHNENASPEVKADILKDRGIIARDSDLAPRDIQSTFDEWVDKQYESVENMTKYSDYVSYLDNYANLLAGKQSSIDRGAEALLGRESLNWGNKLVKSFQRTQVAGSFSSALNQSAQLPQIRAELGAKYTRKAIIDFISGAARKGAWAQESDFLTGKRGVDMLVTDAFDMVMEKAFAPATFVDGLMSTIAVRGKYLQQIDAGKSNAEAMKAADEFGRKIMGSRAKGEQPTAFSSKRPVVQMLNMFQIEALNSWEHLSQDLPEDFRRIEKQSGTKAAAGALASVIVKMLLSAFLLNRLADEIYGGTPAPFDLLGLTANFIASGKGLTTNQYLKTMIDTGLEKLTGDRLLGTDANAMRDSFSWGDALEDTGYNISNDIPFFRNVAGLMGWGDQTLPLPLMGAGQDLQYLISDVKQDIADRKPSLETGMDLLRIMNQVLPGGRQLTKTAEGLQLMLQGGRYVNDKLYYPVENDLATWIQALLFGRSSLYESNEYYAGDNTKLSEAQTEIYRKLTGEGADRFDLYNAIQDYKALDADKDLGSYERGRKQREIVTNTDLTDEQKLELFRALEPNSVNRAEDFEELMDAGLSWAETIKAYDKWAEINAAEDMKTTAKAEAWAAWVERQDYSSEEKEAVCDHLKFWQSIPVETTKVDKLTEAGVDADAAEKLSEVLQNLQPLPGQTDVTDLQKYQAIVESGLSVEDQWKAIIAQTPSSYTSTLDKIEIMRQQGIPPSVWTESKAAMYAADNAGNDDGTTSQSEAKQALDGMSISNWQKAVLWQLANKSWKPKSNPYDTDIGQAIYDQLHGESGSDNALGGLQLGGWDGESMTTPSTSGNTPSGLTISLGNG